MTNRRSYYLVIFLLLLLGGCSGNKKQLNERVSLWRGDKIPYGAFYFHENLHHLFPDAEIVIDKESPRQNGLFNRQNHQLQAKLSLNRKKTAQIVLTNLLEPDHDELLAMLEFVWEGNYLFVSSFHLSQELLDSLHLKTSLDYGYFNDHDSLIVSANNPETLQPDTFSYPGKTYDNYFTEYDSTYVTVLGFNEDGKANFIKIRYENGGAIYLHLAPMAFTNFFLLHKNNKRYYDYALSNLPKGIRLIWWEEYFRNRRNGNLSDFSRAVSWLMSQPPLATAAWILLLLLLLVYLFESKRKQKLIESIRPLKNASLDFVQTIGRLYYQRHDNRNLAEKMSAHFLGHIRSRYNLGTSNMNEEFERKLAFKTEYNAEALRQLLYLVKELPGQSIVSDDEILAFNKQLEEFYKQT